MSVRPLGGGFRPSAGFLDGGGEMGALMRAHDWGATSLGSPDGWAQPLKTLVGVMLAAGQPMFVAFGPERLLLYNDDYGPMLADRHPRALGRPFLDVWPDARPLFERVFAGEPVHMRDIRLFLDRPGRPKEAHFAFSYTPVRDEDGEVVGLFCPCLETTEQVAAAREQMREAERQRLLLQQMPGFVAVLSGPTHVYDYVNDAYLEISGRSDFVGRTVREMFPEIAGQGFYELLDHVYASGEPFIARAMPIRLDRAEGERFLDFIYQPIRNGAGAVAGIFVGGYDVTERCVAERRLAASEARYRQIVEGAEDFAILTLDEGGAITSWNSGAERVAGFSAAEALGRSFSILFTDEHRAEAAVRRSEERLRELNETLEQRVAEALAERKLMADIVETTDACIEAIDAHYDILAINRAGAEAYDRRYGVRPKVGDNLLKLLADAPDLEKTKARWARALAGEDYAVTEETGDPSRERRSYDLRFETLVGARGERVGAFLTSVDATERLRAKAELEATQEALRQSQKMEAVGQLTGGIAHDFNNMLAAVIGALDLLGRRVGHDDARSRRYIETAAEGARRAANLTRRLLAFARQQPLRPEPTDLDRLIAGMSDLLRHSLGAQGLLEITAAEGLWRVRVDPNQLENLLINLAVNARDAMPEGGRLTIETRNVELDAACAATRHGVVPGPYVLICVSDTGCGMTPEVVARAFEPFFTTKKVGEGTGLGLSQAYGFIRQSGGHMTIRSEPGRGATVEVFLPRLGDAQERRPPELARAGASAVACGETVLVVEDEPAVRRFSVEALGELGYRPLEADGAAAALRLLDENPQVALMFTDVVMPEMNGARLAEEARRRRPELKVLFTTGYTRNAVVRDGALDAGVELLGKPFTVEELAAKLRDVLDAPGAG
ncbi:PAS domain-containing protein [Methylocella sp.]|uniref:PAS domain-containing protein n=1 Tax=Methylocella sp. TaxID=1978226 RepID=UPI0035B0D415